MEIDEEATRQLQEQPKVQKYLTWLRDNGCEFPAVNWPVVFAPFGVIGAIATQELKHYDAISEISLDCIMTTDKSRHGLLGDMFADFPEIFDSSEEGDYFRLALFMMHEYGKGDSGFYYPYLNQIDNPYSIIQWEPQELDELQDPLLKQAAIQQNENHKGNWLLLEDIIKGHSSLFPNPSEEQFSFWYMAVTSRCFGYSLPCQMMVPFSDNMNHSNVQSDIGMWERGMDDTVDGTQLRIKRPIEDLPTDCAVWESGYESASEEDDTDNSNSDNEEPDDIQDWTWYKEADPKNVYFKQTTVTGVQEGSQIFIRYGERSNRHLLLWYGFCIPENRYDVVHFKHVNYTFKIRRDKYWKDIVSYYRRKILGKMYIDMVSELYVEQEALGHTVQLLESRIYQYPTTVKQDQILLEQELEPRLRFALMYRISWKEIVIRNLERIKATLRIVEKVMNGTEYLKAQLEEDAALLFPMRYYLREIYHRSDFEDS